MNILHVIRDLSRSTGGPVNALKGLAEAQVAQGHRVTIVSTDAGGDKVIPLCVNVRLVPATFGGWFWAPALKRQLSELVPINDVVHAHMVWDYPIWEASRQANRFAKPFVLRPCGNLESWSLSQKSFKKILYLKLFSSIIHSACTIHFTSEGERVDSAAVTGSRPSVVIPLGVLPEFTEQTAPTALSRHFPGLTDRMIVLFLGRLHPKKQPELVIDAFAQIAKSELPLHLVLAGPVDGTYKATLEARALRLGIADRVTFTGLLGSEGVREAIAAAQVFVLPSQQENFGISVIEAMAGGCPVVISDRVGIAPDVIEAGAGLVTAMQPPDIAQALWRVLTNPALRDEMSEKARRLVLEKYAWPRVAVQVQEMYTAVVTARRQAS